MEKAALELESKFDDTEKRLDKVQYIQTHLCKLFVKISLKSKYIMLQFTVGLNNGKNSVQQLKNVCLFSKNGLSTFFTF